MVMACSSGIFNDWSADQVACVIQSDLCLLALKGSLSSVNFPFLGDHIPFVSSQKTFARILKPGSTRAIFFAGGSLCVSPFFALMQSLIVLGCIKSSGFVLMWVRFSSSPSLGILIHCIVSRMEAFRLLSEVGSIFAFSRGGSDM